MEDGRPSVRAVGGASLDDLTWSEIEAKGYLPVTITDDQRQIAVVFYDRARLAQDVEGGMEAGGYFSSPAVVVLPVVTRSAVEDAVRELAASAFGPVTHW